MNHYQIRLLNNNDYEKYHELINTFRKTFFSKEEFIDTLKKINNNSEIYVIELNNNLIATATIIYEYKFIHNISKIAHIEDVCVHTDFRGKNYGKIIINYLINKSKMEDCYKVTLYCNDELENFYKSCDMTKNGIQMVYYI